MGQSFIIAPPLSAGTCLWYRVLMENDGARHSGFLSDIGRQLESRSGLFLAALLVMFAVSATIRSGAKPFWYDELLTVHICGLPRFSDVWNAIRAGIDLNPPLHHVAVRGAMAALGGGQVAVRMPMLACLLLACISLYLFLRRSLPASYAMAGMLLLWSIAGSYASEARPYAFMMAFGATALLCWANACTNPRRFGWLLGLTLSLALALLSHCYAVLLAFPFAAAEAFRIYRRRRPDWGMWLAMGTSAFPVVLYPFLLNVASVPMTQASAFWSTPVDILVTYFAFIEPVGWAVIVALALIASQGRRPQPEAAKDRPEMPGAELIALAGMAVIPFLAVITAMLTTHSYLSRYGICSLIGLSGLFAWFAADRCGGSHSGGALLVLFLAACLWVDLLGGAGGDAQGGQPRTGNTTEVREHPLLNGLPADEKPIVVANGQAFLQIDYYAPAPLARRIVYLTDTDSALRRTGTAGFEVMYPRMRKLLPLRGSVTEATAFLSQDRPFYVYTNGLSWEWVFAELLARGYSIRVCRRSGASILAEVTGRHSNTASR